MQLRLLNGTVTGAKWYSYASQTAVLEISNAVLEISEAVSDFSSGVSRN